MSYPLNMRKQSSGGYSNNSSLENMPYVTWKGNGIYSNPVAITSSHIRPLTNNDSGNIFPTGFGLARPMKHYRKGKTMPINVLTVDPNNSSSYITKSLIDYNLNRSVKSSTNGNLIAQTIDAPGSYSVKENTSNMNVNICNGTGLVSSWSPITNLTEKPQPDMVSCCNAEKKARQRVLPTNTNLNKHYYQTNQSYLYNRCQTFEQKEFHFLVGAVDKQLLQLFKTYPFVTAKVLEYSKPGDALSLVNYYASQCNPNIVVDLSVEIGFIHYMSKLLLSAGYISSQEHGVLIDENNLDVKTFINKLQSILTKDEYKKVIDYLFQLAANPDDNFSLMKIPSNQKGCSQVYYKPNNPQYAKQGSVSSSTRMLKLNVDTINTAAYNRKKLRSGSSGNMFLYKDKVENTCNNKKRMGNAYNFHGQQQIKTICKTSEI